MGKVEGKLFSFGSKGIVIAHSVLIDVMMAALYVLQPFLYTIAARAAIAFPIRQVPSRQQVLSVAFWSSQGHVLERLKFAYPIRSTLSIT
jgi:hypothetical protein